MNEIETGRLLTAAKVLDPRFPEPDEDGLVLRLWSRTLHDIPAKVAEEALTEYYRSARYRETREPISPADIVQWHKDRRRYAPQEYTRPEFNPGRIHAGVDRAIAALAARKAIGAGEDPDDAADAAEGESGMRRLVLAIACPVETCPAGAGQQCLTSTGRPLTKTTYHPARVDAASGGETA